MFTGLGAVGEMNEPSDGLYWFASHLFRHDTRREDSTRDGNEDGNIHPVLMDSEDSGVGEAALDGGQPQNATHGDSGRIWLVRSLSTPSLTINFALWEVFMRICPLGRWSDVLRLVHSWDQLGLLYLVQLLKRCANFVL